ncbi:hypothetical protein O8E88_001414 [Flavobacterium psychrophilum]|uniref:Lipoprotein n=1 Tax=Flavobacterium psychrophilum TaxID=96345 RepID=A0A7U2NGJ4_FLAPS|nr:hypothetical protein [Flavobacterium psychrophilum]AIN73265.1 hypothetical protein FPG3_01925 [Flavobacterium psychrophilum FPG3]EKT2069613.1 hypothetical protein [Flavobacterium psychrophilum]EKT2071873.1 hypothetical protein [Flavobacterium psychrophilum]EKT4491395.1 hypothetical protein [Flavobacterium psychrophilum]EKT4510702.1 hypothetical protein [Flavobacterium psychrophilum]
MKKLIFSLSIIALIFTGCSSNNDDPIAIPVAAAPASGTITGTIASNITYAYGNYTLVGIVKINPGVTVTFDAGSTITCDKTVAVDNALVVLNGGKLNINGTASNPVVFTEKSQIPGKWGGIIIYGDAPINAAGGATTSTSEDGNNIVYGGTNPAHNGGSLNYARVEYAGSQLASGVKENNGFTFYSCGSGTKLDHLVSYKGADDGYEFFGGTVSATNLISYGNYDDAFDWQDGWQGQNNSNWYAYQTGKGNYGMEIESSANNNAYYPVVTNITLKRAAGCRSEIDDNQVDAFQFKREGNGFFNNIIIDGYTGLTTTATPAVTFEGAVVRIEEATTNTNQVNASKIKVTNVKVTNTNIITPIGRSASISVSFPGTNWSTSASATGCSSLVTGSWSTVNGVNLIP